MGELVVGFDGSDSSRSALAWAVEEARLRGDDLTVVTVAQPPALLFSQIGIDEGTERRAEQTTMRRAHQLLEEAVSRHADSGVDIATDVLRDAPTYRALIQRETDTSTLVLGSRGLSAYRRLLLGSVSQQVVVHARGAVVVVPSSERKRDVPDKVIVGVDSSEYARAALRQAATEASLRGCELELIMVQPPPPAANDRSPSQAAIDAYVWTGALPPVSSDPALSVQMHREVIVEHWRHAAEARIEKELAKVDPATLPATVTTTVVGADSPAKGLLDAAESATLLVVGRRGRGGFTGMLLGSVSQHCVRHATSPIMVVPPDAA